MLTDEEWRLVLEHLRDATAEQSLRWSVLPQEVSNDDLDPTFIANTSAITQYRIWSRDGDGRFPYRMAIMRREDVGDDWSGVARFEAKPFDDGDGSVSGYIDALYSLAARSASGNLNLAKTLLEEIRSVRES